MAAQLHCGLRLGTTRPYYCSQNKMRQGTVSELTLRLKESKKRSLVQLFLSPPTKSLKRYILPFLVLNDSLVILHHPHAVYRVWLGINALVQNQVEDEGWKKQVSWSWHSFGF